MLYSQRRHSGFFSSTLYGIFPCHSGLWIPCAPTKHNNKKEEHMTNKPSSAMHSNRTKKHAIRNAQSTDVRIPRLKLNQDLAKVCADTMS